MIDLGIFIALMVGLMATRKIWNAYVKQKTEDVHLAIESARNEQQAEMKRVLDERTTIISRNGKWIKLDDINDIKALTLNSKLNSTLKDTNAN